MIVEEDLSNAEVTPREDRLQRSRVAQELAHWGTFSYQLALLFVVLCLLAGSAFAAFTPEPLGQRLMSLVFVAFLPAFAAYSIGSLTFWTLRGVSAIYDPACMELASVCERITARLLVRARRCCDKAWRVFIFGATFPVRLTAQILIWLIPSAA